MNNVIFQTGNLKTLLLFKTPLNQKRVAMWMLYLIDEIYAENKEENAETGVGAGEEVLGLRSAARSSTETCSSVPSE